MTVPVGMLKLSYEVETLCRPRIEGQCGLLLQPQSAVTPMTVKCQTIRQTICCLL